jgi:tetratricopeptide (TPR) repeat protein
MRQPASRHPDFAYRMASYRLGKDPNEALAALRQAMQSYGPDSLERRGTASRMGMLVTSSNVAMATGALADLDRLFGILTTVDSVLPGSLRSGRGEPTTSLTDPLEVTARAILGVTTTADRRTLDAAIARTEALPEPARAQARQREWGLAYAGYVITHNPKYLDIIRRWSGHEPPLVLQALAALRKGDTAGAAQLAAKFTPPDTARVVSTPNEIEDPLSQAVVLSAVGQPRAAITVLEAIDPTRLHVLEADPRWAAYARSLFERGLLYEQIGSRARAVAAYERYLDLMRDADAALEPQKQAARARVQALRDAPGTTLPSP